MSHEGLGTRHYLGLATLVTMFVSSLGCPPKETPSDVETPSITVTTVNSLRVNRGADEDATIRIRRTNFTGPVTLDALGLPAGVTVEFSDNPVTGTETEMNVAVAEEVEVGSYSFSVRATGSGVDGNSATVELLVEGVAPTFRLENIDPLTIQQGTSGVRAVTITRFGGFTGDVTVTVTDLTTGMAATVEPITTGGSSVVVRIETDDSAPLGTFNVTVRGNATGLPEETESLEINITPGAGETVSLDFSVCTPQQRPIWFAYRDGTGPWVQVSPGTVPHVYTFGLVSESAAIALTTYQAGPLSTLVVHAIRSELLSADLEELCDVIKTGKTVFGSVTGIQTGVEGATLSLGSSVYEAPSDGPVTFNDVPDGNLDLVAYRWSFSVSERMLIRRDLDPANESDIGTIDFTGTEAFDPVFANITVQGGGGGGLQWFTEYATSPAPGMCYFAPLDDDALLLNTFAVGGAPAARQEAGDFHVVTVTDGTYTVSETFETMANRTIAFGEPVSTPTMTDVTGAAGYRRLRAELTLPAEYDSNATLWVSEPTRADLVTVIATPAWLGGLDVSIEIPDFTGVSGWDDLWAPPSTSETTWGFSAYGWSGDDCTEGAREVTALFTGTVG